MSKAHRPTYVSVKAHENQGGKISYVPSKSISSREVPAQLKMKVREKKENVNFKEELLKKEQELLKKKEREEEYGEEVYNLKENEEIVLNEENINKEEEEEKNEEEEEDDDDEKDIELAGSDDESDNDESELLLLELEKIKKEKEEIQLKKEKEEREERENEIIKGNPLLNQEVNTVKRKWTDDVVFKNQTKDEPKLKKKFINDTTRSDFHRRFLSKYIH
jgi:protein CWC15